MKKIKTGLPRYVADDRRHIAGLLTEALNSLTESREDFMAAIRKIVAYHEEETGYYPVLAISKEDIRSKGFNPDRLSPEEMRGFEDAFADDAFLMDAYWDIVSQVSEGLDLPALRTEIGRLYEAYKQEYGREPLYAGIWLEDKGYNDLPWAVTVKLSPDVDEETDDQVYMNFSGFEEMKQWLFSLEDDKNSDVDWCYDDPQQRIGFFDTL